MDGFKVNDKVIEINSNRKGTIIALGPQRRGSQMYSVLFEDSNIEEHILDAFLEHDFNIQDPFERCKQNVYGNHTDFVRINTSFKIENSSNNTLSSLKASRTKFRPYQFKPLLKFLNSDNRKILVADEVGLGKTIEAGHIMLELKARNEFKNALIVCPNSLKIKWKEELKEKFNLSFKIYDDTKNLIEDLRTNQSSFKGIVNYEKIRIDKEESGTADSNLVSYVQNHGIMFSIVLCDEAHRLRNSNTLAYSGANVLMDAAKSAVFLTATPVMIDEDNLYNLLHLLNKEEYSDRRDFKNEIALNQPFLQALLDLKTKTPLPTIADSLYNYEVSTIYYIGSYERRENHLIGEYYKENPLFSRIIKWMKEEEDTLELRAKLQYDITSMSEMSHVFSRTRKRDVTADWSQAERHPYPISVELSSEEREIYDEIIDQYVEDNSYDSYWGDRVLSQGAALGLVQKKRQVASSVYAYLNGDCIWKGEDEYADCYDSKVAKLIEIINNTKREGESKIIVFAIFKKTLQYLKIRLEKEGLGCVLISGDYNSEERHAKLMQFRDDESTSVLLSSEVGSEGLDMQFCCSMVNYDLPWNPMVVEQRIGRIDRFGQKSPVVKIYNLLVKDSIQETIYNRLLNRIGIFRSSIGDLEAILDSKFGESGDTIQMVYTKLEKELFSNRLSKDEIQNKMDEIAQAMENEKENLIRIEEGLTNTLTNDSYFRNEIDRILRNNSYLTDGELYSYLVQMIDRAMPACTLKSCGDKTYIFSVPKTSPKKLISFVTRYTPIGDEYEEQMKMFKNRNRDNCSFILTFDQDVAFDNKNIEFVNLYHPIVLASLNYFKEEDDEYNKTFCFDIRRSELPESLSSNNYILAVYEIHTSQMIYGTLKDTKILMPVLYDTERMEIVHEESVVDEFFGKTQVKGVYRTASNESNPTPGDIEDMKFDLSEHVAHKVAESKKELILRDESRRNQKLLQFERFYNTSIANQKELVSRRKSDYELYQAIIETKSSLITKEEEKSLKNKESQLKSAETRLANMIDSYDEERNKILYSPSPTITPKLISLNLITVI